MECEISQPLLLEEIVGRRIEEYGLKFLEGEKRYSLANTHRHGLREGMKFDCFTPSQFSKTKNLKLAAVVTSKLSTERALNLKMHPMSRHGNITYEHIRLYDEGRSESVKDYVLAGEDIEVARFREGKDWARIKLSYFKGKLMWLADLSTAGNFTNSMREIFQKAHIDYKKWNYREYQNKQQRAEYQIETKDIKLIAPACVDIIMEKYTSNLDYAKRQIKISESSLSR